MKINTTNAAKVQESLDVAQKRCRTRMVSAAEVRAAVADVEVTIKALPRNERKGIRFTMTDGTGRSSFANSYNGIPETTWVTVERGATAWFVTAIERAACGRAGAVQTIVMDTHQEARWVRSLREQARIHTVTPVQAEASSSLTAADRLVVLAGDETVEGVVVNNPATPVRTVERLARTGVAWTTRISALTRLRRVDPAELTPPSRLALELHGQSPSPTIAEGTWAMVDAAFAEEPTAA